MQISHERYDDSIIHLTEFKERRTMYTYTYQQLLEFRKLENISTFTIVEDITPSNCYPCASKVTESFPTIAKFLIWATEWTLVNDCQLFI